MPARTKLEDFSILFQDMREHVYDQETVRTLLERWIIPFQEKRDTLYERSFAKRGLLGFWHGGIGRRTDRLDPAFKQLLAAMISDADEQELGRALYGLFDSLVDTCAYAAMGICLLSAMYPEAFNRYIQDMDKQC